MRLIVIKQASDLQTLSSELFNSGSKSTSKAVVGNATLERIKSLNPHVDFQRIEAGTVLLLPDTPELKDSKTQSVAGDAFADFSTHTIEGLKTVAERIRTGADALELERTAVAAVLKTAAVKRQIESDPLLKKQLDDASADFTAEQNRAQEAMKQVKAMQDAAVEELKALERLLG